MDSKMIGDNQEHELHQPHQFSYTVDPDGATRLPGRGGASFGLTVREAE
jgi:hypothetical protein